jgi:hypothetical protein
MEWHDDELKRFGRKWSSWSNQSTLMEFAWRACGKPQTFMVAGVMADSYSLPAGHKSIVLMLHQSASFLILNFKEHV